MTQLASMQSTDIARFLSLLHGQGGYFEIRALECPQWPGADKLVVQSGYFSDPMKAAKEITRIEKLKPSGIYVTLNPCEKEIAARRFDKISHSKKDASTPDAKIVCRRWLLVDCDPVRASGVSSTDAEMNAAIDLAGRIADELSRDGWPTPIQTMSGNGAGLYYRIDLPNDDTSKDLVERVLKGLAERFSNLHVAVDTSVHNAARVTKVAGTVARKGSDFRPDDDDETGHRPHRRSWFIEPESPIQTVSKELLESVAIKPQAESKCLEPSSLVSVGQGWSIDEWLRDHNVPVNPPVAYNGGRKWTFSDLPIPCQSHPGGHGNDGSAFLIQGSDGKLGAGCKHDRCKWWKWKDLRQAYEPGCYDRESYDDVDISKIAGQMPAATASVSQAEAVTQSAKADNRPAVDHMYEVPGFIRSVMNLSLETARYPNTTLAFCGSLALMSFLIGRRVTYRGLSPNIYLMALASSGSGKDQARKVNVHLLQEAGLGGCLGDSIASGEGLEESLFRSPQSLYQLDELDSLVRAMAGAKEARFESIAERLLRFYTSSNSTYYLRRKADDQEARYILHPHLVLYGTCTPQGFYDAISGTMLTNGLFARLLVIEADARGKRQIAKPAEADPSIMQEIEHWKQLGCEGGNLASRNPKVLELPEEDDARDELEQACDRYDAAYDRCRDKRDECGMTIWSRAGEQATRLAALYACSANALDPRVTLEAIRWSTRFVDFHVSKMLQAADELVAESPFAKTLSKLLKDIRESPSGVDHSALLRSSHLKAREFAEAIQTLMERGQVVFAVVEGRKRYFVANF